MRIDAQRLRDLRTERGWSQAELARRSAVGQARISELENPGRVRDDHARALAEALGVPVDRLLVDEDEPMAVAS